MKFLAKSKSPFIYCANGILANTNPLSPFGVECASLDAAYIKLPASSTFTRKEYELFVGVRIMVLPALLYVKLYPIRTISTFS